MGKKNGIITFLGTEKSWDDVYEYYMMLSEAYDKYCAKDVKMTAARKLYITGFKQKVDSTAKALGIRSEVELPDDVKKFKLKKTNEEDGQGQDAVENDTARAL